MEITSKSQLLELSDLLFDVSCRLEKARAIQFQFGDNMHLQDTSISKEQAMYNWYAHNTNSLLFCSVNDYLYEGLDNLQKAQDILQEYRHNNVVQ